MGGEDDLREAKSMLIEQYRAHVKDTGSPEVQIALLSERINYLTDSPYAGRFDENPMHANEVVS